MQYKRDELFTWEDFVCKSHVHFFNDCILICIVDYTNDNIL